MRRELGFCIGVGKRGNKRGNFEVMKMDVRNGLWVPTLDPSCGLAIVGGCANIMNRHVVCQDQAGEMKKLIEMALCRKRYYNHNHLALVKDI